MLDEKLKPDFAALAKLCDGDFQIVSRDDADATWLVLYNRDNKAPSFYRYDRKSKKGSFLFTTRPKLDGFQLSPMKPVKIKARDGLTLQGYLTTPAGLAPKNLPLVLDVHGRSITAARRASARSSCTPATASGAPRCRTISRTPFIGL